MYKFNKCITLGRKVPRSSPVRFVGCGDKCPPRYECKRPEEDDLMVQIEELRQMRTPTLFQPQAHADRRIHKNIFYFVCLPSILCLIINKFYFNTEELKRPKFIEFPYMRIRRKPFPWDPDRTLFHNPRINALSTGYEIEVPEEMEFDPREERK